MIDAITRLARRLSILLRLDHREREMDEEMRFHLQMEAQELARDGLSPVDAERRARLSFGGVERHKEDGRDARGMRLLEDLGQDLRYAARQWVANPSFTIATVLTLSLGIGASTVMYSFSHLNPVPFEHGDRIVYVRQYSKTGCTSCQNIAGGNALTFKAASRSLESMSILGGARPLAFRGRERSEVIKTQPVTYEYFHTVGVAPLVGRTFLAADTLSGQTPVVVISEPMWRTRFGADSSIVGRDILLDGTHYTVRGVIPHRYTYPERTDAWTIYKLSAVEATDHTSNLSGQAIGRLRAGATIATAAAEEQTIGERIAREYPAAFKDWSLGVRPLGAYDGWDNDRTTAIFLTAVGFVLLISCINIAGLLIARLTRRRRELAVRAAMGAHSSRIARQLVTETMLVCITAAPIGLAFAFVGLRAILDGVPESAAPAGWTRVGIDWRAFVFALGLASIAGIVIGLWPSIRFARPELNIALRDGVRAASTRGANGGERIRRALVVAELALSLVLLTAAGLLVRTVAKLAKAPVGFSSDHVLTMSLQLPAEIDGKRVESRGYFDRLAEEVTRVPGVTSAGAVAFLPLSRSGWSAKMFQVEGRAALKGSGGTRTQIVTPGYFETFKIPLLRGRALTASDVDTARRVALINQELARRFFADDDPIGRVLVLTAGDRMTVVGVVGDVKQQGATSGAGQEILMPAAIHSRRSMNLVVRTSREPSELAADITKAVERYDPNLAINRVRTMGAVVDDFLAPFRVERMLMGGFAVIALVIATMGLYAIMSFTAASRMREFGVRLALGASSSSLIGLVLGQGLRLAGLGVAIGVVGAIAATRLMRSMLFDVAPGDPVTIGIVGAGVCLMAFAAGVIPARRAMAVDPVRSLREE